MKFFKDRKLIIATKHEKERVITPLLKEHLEVEIFVPTDFDTDKFGTFSGEVERQGTALDALRLKCREAMEQYDFDLGIASEGSFGAHPSLFFAQADDEMVLMIDQKNGLEIIAREVSLETNFNAEKINSYEQLASFAKQINFPSHGLILKDSEGKSAQIIKNINDWDTLKLLYESLSSYAEAVWVETDMRAHRNPTRMKVIEKAIQNLLKKVNSLCPSCDTPGYDVQEVIKGLPCEWCHSPTQSILALHYKCKKCDYSTTEQFPKGKHYESPEFCSYCNP